MSVLPGLEAFYLLNLLQRGASPVLEASFDLDAVALILINVSYIETMGKVLVRTVLFGFGEEMEPRVREVSRPPWRKTGNWK